MASAPNKRRVSKELPPDLSELMDKLIKYAASFIGVYNNSEDRMREIVREFRRIVSEVEEVQEKTNTTRRAGRDLAGDGIFGFVATVITSPAVVCANISKILNEKGSAKEVENLGKEFMKIVKPLKNDLEEIKTTCEKLEQKSTEALAGKTLTDMEDFQGILRRVSDLRKTSGDAIFVVVGVIGLIQNLVTLVVNVFKFSPTPEEDKKLRDAITQSGDQCQKVNQEFDKMKNALKDFTAK